MIWLGRLTREVEHARSGKRAALFEMRALVCDGDVIDRRAPPGIEDDREAAFFSSFSLNSGRRRFAGSLAAAG